MIVHVIEFKYACVNDFFLFTSFQWFNRKELHLMLIKLKCKNVIKKKHAKLIIGLLIPNSSARWLQ